MTGHRRLIFLIALIFLTRPVPCFAQERDSSARIGKEGAPIPSAARQAEIARILDEAFSLTKADTQAKKQQAAKKLVKSSGSDLSLDEQYVVLMTVTRLATDAGDFALFWEAVGRIVKSFEGDPEDVRARHMTEFLDRCKINGAVKSAMEEAIRQAQSAAAINHFQVAGSLLNAASAAAQRTKAAAVSKAITEARKSVSDREARWKAFDLATIALSANDSDRTANETVGKWYALYTGNWNDAMPFLAKGSDTEWAVAARQDLDDPQDAMAQVALGDRWWDIAQAETGEAKAHVLMRASKWYDLALPGLASLQKQRVAKRLSDIGPRKPNATVTSEIPTTANIVEPVAPKKPRATEWVDLLAWAEGMDWSPRGVNWNEYLEGKPAAGGIRFKRLPFGRFPLPAIIDGDYMLEAEFTRFDGDQSASIFFPLGNRTLQLEIGAEAGASGGVHGIDGKNAIAGNPTTRRPCMIENNQRHTIRITARRDGDIAAFTIDWNGNKDYIAWEGKYARLSDATPPWATNMLRHVWIGSYKNNLVFHRIQLRMQSGAVRRDSITDSDRSQDRRNGLVRLVSERPRNVSVGWGQFGVNQLPLEMAPVDVERGWPLITRDFRTCEDFYGVHPPSRLKVPIPQNARCFTAVGYNESTKTVKYQTFIDGKEVSDSGECGITFIRLAIPPGASLLELVTDPMENNSYDFTYWCYPRFHSLPLEKVTDAMFDSMPVQSGFSVASASVGFGVLTHNRPIELQTSGPVRFRDAHPCDEFLYCHAPATLTYDVPDGMTRFTAIGYKVLFHHHVKFEVWANAGRIFQSPQAGIVAIDVTLPQGTKTLELKVDDLGGRAGDHSLWCFPRLHRN